MLYLDKFNYCSFFELCVCYTGKGKLKRITLGWTGRSWCVCEGMVSLGDLCVMWLLVCTDGAHSLHHGCYLLTCQCSELTETEEERESERRRGGVKELPKLQKWSQEKSLIFDWNNITLHIKSQHTAMCFWVVLYWTCELGCSAERKTSTVSDQSTVRWYRHLILISKLATTTLRP